MKQSSLFVLFVLALALPSTPSFAQTGVSNDRVSLPDGPGSLEGIGENVSVDANMGLMRYGVPIRVPAGFAGLTPSLSLAYSSGSGNEVVGMGWMMSVPNIERMTFRGLPVYDTTDRFAANGGEQLIKVSDGQVAHYRSRYEGSFVRYGWHSRGEGAEGFWTAEYPDGRVGYFGATADGTLVPSARLSGDQGTYKYMLVDMTDLYDHNTRYSYRLYNGVPLLDSVGYVFTDGPDTPTYEVRFDYEQRSDFQSDGKPGFFVQLQHRLSGVNVYTRGTKIRRYALTYEPYADSGGMSRLSEVRTYGLGDALYPAIFSFGYSRALGGVCAEEACGMPYLTDLGTLGIQIGTGDASLVDINGDALADVIDTSQEGAHRFYINTLSEDGTQTFEGPRLSAIGTRSSHRLGSARVQLLDVDGDGFTDLLRTQGGQVLRNTGAGDWSELTSLTGTGGVDSLLTADDELAAIRFLDYDNDKKIDLIRSSIDDTTVYHNVGGGGFEPDPVTDDIGEGFTDSFMELADMNGDGLLDPVQVREGSIRFRFNLGWGQWTDWVDVGGLDIGGDERPRVKLEDINGDALADIVIVAGRSAKYAINRSGETFLPFVTIDEVNGQQLPDTDATTVVFADMNANGSSDIVWIGNDGHIQYLELFPVRPNLLARVENALGKITTVKYGSSVQHMVRDGGVEQWPNRLPHAMLVVDRLDTWDELTNVHEVRDFRYHDAFYDGAEKQFRGFARVETLLIGDESHESGRTETVYDVGATDTYRKGLQLSAMVESDGQLLNTSATTYQDCPLEQADTLGTREVRFVCPVESQSVLIEGTDPSAHVTTMTRMTYDGYGNVIRNENLGVTSIGGAGCEPCDRDAEVFGAPCGATCQGDELYSETEFVQQGADTDDRWIISAPYRSRSFGLEGGEATETLTYYDGPEFEGMPLGTLTRGTPIRQTSRINADSDEVITAFRRALDRHGNVIDTLDPLGEVDGTTHRRQYTMDEDGLRVTRTEILLEDKEGAPYRLRQEVHYEPIFDKPSESSAWLLIEADGSTTSSRRSSFYTYDAFGRIDSLVKPGGDTVDSPTQTFTYALGSPTTRVITAMRSKVGGAMDLERVTCMDGRGRTYQSKVRLQAGRYQVNGFKIFNLRNATKEVFQPYMSDTSDCDTAPPADVLSTTWTYDAAYRPTGMSQPDAELYGTPSINRTLYAPLTTLSFDPNDNDPDSPFAETPTITRTDGLGRTVSMERLLGPQESATTTLHYDPLGRLTGYTDAAGHAKTQVYDLLGRVTRVEDPNAGTTTMTWDDASNLVATTDARGVTTHTDFDGANRAVGRWDEADPDATRITWTFDFDPACATCTNGEGRAMGSTYPLEGLGGEGVDRIGYDARGRAILTARNLAGHGFEFQAVYDNADRLTETTYPDGTVIAQTFDDASRLTAIPGYVHTIEYDDRAQMREMGCADGTGTTMTYDARLRMDSMTTTGAAGTLQGFEYAFDRASNITSITDTDAFDDLSSDATYTYDAWYRLLTADIGAADDAETLSYTYDTIDNVLSRTSSLDKDSPAHLGDVAYDPMRPNAASRAGDMDLGYDDAGDLTQRGSQDLSWDFMRRLVSAGDDASFFYAHNQRRVAKVEGPSTTLYPSTSFEVRDGITALYLRVGRKRVARLQNDNLATTLYEDSVADGEINVADAFAAGADSSAPVLRSSVRRMLMEATAPTTFLHHDHLGSVTLATTDEGVVGHREFYAYGRERGGGSGFVDNYGFTGQELDESTGLIHFDYRYLDATTGRWISPDPMFAVATGAKMGRSGEATTAYAYVGNRLVNSFDPNGLKRFRAIKRFFSRGKSSARSAGESKNVGVGGKTKEKIGKNIAGRYTKPGASGHLKGSRGSGNVEVGLGSASGEVYGSRGEVGGGVSGPSVSASQFGFGGSLVSAFVKGAVNVTKRLTLFVKVKVGIGWGLGSPVSGSRSHDGARVTNSVGFGVKAASVEVGTTHVSRQFQSFNDAPGTTFNTPGVDLRR